MKWGLLLLLFFGFAEQALSQLSTIPPVGPKALGMGGISAVNADIRGVLNNPGGIADTKALSAFVSYRSIFNFAPFNTVAAGVVVPTSLGTAGLGVFRFGDELFNTQMLCLSIARKIGIMQLGVKVGYLQINIEGFGSRGVFVADIGGIARLTPHLSFGAYIYNFSQSAISTETRERIPTVIRLALSYKPTEAFLISIEGEKEVNLKPEVRLGLQYQLIESLYLRTGFSGLNNTHSFGGGLLFNRFVADYAFRANRHLGNTHNFGLSYFLSR